MVKVIYLLGMDGSGKSTLSKNLVNKFNKNGIYFEHKWFLEREFSFIRKLIRTSTKNRAQSNNDPFSLRNDKLIYNFKAILYYFFVVLDYTIHSWKIYWKARKQGSSIIFDRYIFDVFFSLNTEFKIKPKYTKIGWIFCKLNPKVNLGIYLNVDPKIAFSRKPQEFGSLQNSENKHDFHSRIFKVLKEKRVFDLIELDANQTEKDLISSIKFDIVKGVN